jgi:hypothetical protein
MSQSFIHFHPFKDTAIEDCRLPACYIQFGINILEKHAPLSVLKTEAAHSSFVENDYIYLKNCIAYIP